MKEKWQNVLLAPLAWMLHLLAWMPWWWIWLNADVMYFIAYRVLGYRKRIVRKNLVDSFPNLSLDEIKRIERQFYRNFVDYFFEAIKCSTSATKRCGATCSFATCTWWTKP